MRNSDMPAMPQSFTQDSRGRVLASMAHEGCGGITKREHFAGLAMQGFCAFHGDGLNFDVTAKEAVEMADLLLAELEKTK